MQDSQSRAADEHDEPAWRRLGPEARTVWAKHDRDSDAWMPLWRHMADAAAVAGLLWDRWLPRNLRRLISQALPDGERDGRTLAVWLAAAHDIGKATPAFACQVDSAANRMRDAGLAMPTAKQFGADRRLAPHDLAGQLLLQEWLENQGWSARSTMQFAVVVGGHHGTPPDFPQLDTLDRHPELLRTPEADEIWRQVQTDLLEACADATKARTRLPDWRQVKLSQPTQVLLSALVIVADWIASNPQLFPYSHQQRSRADDERVAAAWQALDLPQPWQPSIPPCSADELFATRFTLPPDARIRPVQKAVVELARSLPEPGLIIVEAPMGEGKTEAALAAAEILAARSGAGGCFVALPTMATSNAMFPRLLDWLDHLPAQAGERRTVMLAHSKAALNTDFAELDRVAVRPLAAVEADSELPLPRPGQETGRAAPAELVAHQWLWGRKKAMLSTFVVGTIDQLLMAGLKSRHLALRHLAVAGKVVVIDEVHAYDAYMSRYLDRVLGWLGAYRVPVVMLSATLPAPRRRELAEAYAGGEAVNGLKDVDGYPLLIGVAPGHAPVVERPAASADRRREVILERSSDDLTQLVGRLDQELAGGGCALVVRNTVDRVLETAKALRTVFGADQVTVAHSRFLDLDRAAKDRRLLERFGPTGERPGRHVVVASQVAEQSLDVDFDLLVTDLAPVDLVLQRIGRLHRRQRGEAESERPERLREARCFLTGVVNWDAGPPEPVPGSQSVYGEYPLLRAAAVLSPYLTGERKPLCLPQDISDLVQRAYGDSATGPSAWSPALERARDAHERTLRQKQERADAFRLDEVRKPGRALVGWLHGDVGDADDTRAGRAQVRDSDESIEVLVVQRQSDGSWITPPWLEKDRGKTRGGLALPLEAPPPPWLAKVVAACGLRLPWQLCKPGVIERVISELEKTYVAGWQVQECHWLAGELLLVLTPDGRTTLAGHELRYTPQDGLEVTR